MAPPPEATDTLEQPRGRPTLALLLLGLTLMTTTAAGALQQAPAGATAADLVHLLPSGLLYSLPLMLILICHEAGHYVVGRRRGVAVSLPYFIPFPLPPLGTLGAVIGLREEVRDRNHLFDVAAAGPLCGLAVALPVLLIGLHLSPVGPLAVGDMLEGQSLLYLGLKALVKGQLLPGVVGGQLVDVQLHPMAFAGWVGLLVTMINLLPVGQLDGGHLAAAYFGADHQRRSQLVHRGLLGVALGTLGYVAWLGHTGRQPMAPLAALRYGGEAALPWLVWAAALLLMRRMSGGRWHPEVDPAPLSPGRRALAVALLGLLGLLFMPFVMRGAT